MLFNKCQTEVQKQNWDKLSLKSGGAGEGFGLICLKDFKYILVLFSFIFSFMPFFSFVPIGTDVQPLFLIFIVLLFFVSNIMQKINLFELLFLLMSLLSIIYINFDEPFFDVRKSLTLLLAFIVFHFFRVYKHKLTGKMLYNIVLFNFIGLVFHYLMPSLFAQTLGNFVRVVKILSMDGARGASGFAPEPGMMGSLAVFYIAVAYYLRDYRNCNKYFIKILIMSIIMIALTKSGSGFLFLLLFFFTYHFRLAFKDMGVIFIIGLIFAFIIYSFDFGRGGDSIKMLIENPKYLFLVDPSIGQRVYNIAVGFLSVYENPFGYGAGSYDSIIPLIDYKYHLLNYIKVAGQGNVSAFAKYSVELGFLFWIFLLYFVIVSVYRSSFAFTFLSLLFISASFSILFPPIWFLLSISIDNSRERKFITNRSYRLYNEN